MHENKEREEYRRFLKTYDIDVIELKKIMNEIIEFESFFGDIMQFGIFYEYDIPGFKLMKRLQDANAWFKKANYLMQGISVSLNLSIDSAIVRTDEFTPYRVSSEDKAVYFHIENAIYRLFSLWEVMGHLCNHYYNLGYSIERMNYMKVFNMTNFSKLDKSIKKFSDDIEVINVVKRDFQKICEYIRTDYCYEDFESKGHHKYLKEIRNSFTHRENPHDFILVNNSKSKKIYLPDDPLYETKMAIEEFQQVYLFICQFFKLFAFEFSQYGIGYDFGFKKYNPIKKLYRINKEKSEVK